MLEVKNSYSKKIKNSGLKCWNLKINKMLLKNHKLSNLKTRSQA